MTIKRPDTNNVGGNGGKSGGDHGSDGGSVQLTERQRKICHLIAASSEIKAKQMAVIANISQRTTERELATLQKNGIIRFDGNARNGHWMILKQLN